MRLLCIANPGAYRPGATDVPESYARLAALPGLELFHADTRALQAAGGRIEVCPVPAGFRAEDFHRLSSQPTRRLAPGDLDVAFCRTLKPFPEGYLERLCGWSRQLPFVNDPAGIRRQLAPSFLLEAAGDFLPPFLVTRDPEPARAFLRRHGRVVAKRPGSCGGREVFRVGAGSDGRLHLDNVVEGSRCFDDFAALFAHLLAGEAGPLLWMRYLPRVVQGDKRLLVVDGEIYGAYLRRSTRGHWVQNVSVGAVCEPAEPGEADRELVAATAPAYRAAGIHVLGYDLIEDDDGSRRVSEINAGNVGGLARLESLGAPGSIARFGAWLGRFAARRSAPG